MPGSVFRPTMGTDGGAAHGQRPTEPPPHCRPSPFLPVAARARRLVSVALAVSAFVVVAVSLVWVDVGHHLIRVGLGLAELAVVIAFGRLWWITRPERATA